MSSVTTPNVQFSILSASQKVQNEEHKVLFVGQMLTGTATAGTLVKDIENGGAENALFGRNSMLAGMIRSFKEINGVNYVSALPLADATGTAAAGEVAFTGTAASAGTITVNVGSRREHSFELAVASGDTATDVGDALEAAVNADLDIIVTALNAVGAVSLTCDHDGTIGNTIGIEVTGTVAGLSYSLTAFTSGATDPTVTDIFDVIANERYQTIVYPANYDKSEVIDFLDARFDIDNELLQGVALTCETDSVTDLKATYTALNSRSYVGFANLAVAETTYKGSGCFELDVNIASKIAAVRALRFADDESLTSLVTVTDAAKDAFGGVHMSSFPYHNTLIPYLPIIDVEKWFTRDNQDDLLDDGASIFGNNPANAAVIFGDAVTTYKTDILGQADITYKYLNYVDTISASAEYFYNNNRRRFGQTRLTENDIVAGHKMANAGVVRAAQTEYYTDLSKEGYVLTQAGVGAVNYFKTNLDVTLDLSVGKVTIAAMLPIVTQLRQIIATLQVSFTTS